MTSNSQRWISMTNPVYYLRTFVDLIMLRATPDAIICRAFPSILRREARDWVATILPKLICTFDDFSKQFAAYFSSSKHAKKIAISLMQLTQDKDELLKDSTTWNEDLKGVTCPHDDALVIVADIADFDVNRLLVDNGSAADVMSWRVFLGLKISPSKIKHVKAPMAHNVIYGYPLLNVDRAVVSTYHEVMMFSTS
ncbi:Integrase catalytic domain-containing protein [Abeliophyllum distichum]|uniref:Integrase catalytic domain-containing protein n=1 Tax=Abeliophyllum distichum TaxID=126358 RepID=A0ABD1SXY3_9LAMI